MPLTEEQKLENFKHILECFVATIEWAGNYKEHEAAARQFPGHAAYIQPHLADGSFCYSGQGYKGHAIQSLIDQWAALDDTGFATINVCTHTMTTGSYLNWSNTSLSWSDTKVYIVAKIASDATQGTQRVRSLFVCHNEGVNIPADITMTLEELGLFDGQGPNDNLKRFWLKFKDQIDHWNAAHMVQLLTELTRHNKNVVLTGAPGTGKTYLAKQVAQALTGGQVAQAQDGEQSNPFVGFVQFHPSYDYSDFVEGLRPENQTNGQIGFALQAGIFKKFCAKAKADEDNLDQHYVFIIDEINRGELSKIFGELFYAIDPDYRGPDGTVQTQYHNMISKSGDQDEANKKFAEGFYVPKNVYIIATMNDVDRSVESIDFAFRRRFTWFEVKPESRMTMLEVDNLKAVKDNEALKAKLERANFTALCQGYCKRLNDAISKQDSLGSAYKIGPAYFLKTLNYLNLDAEVTENAVKAALEEKVWCYHLDPLLREYLRGKRQEEIDKIIKKLSSRYYDEKA